MIFLITVFDGRFAVSFYTSKPCQVGDIILINSLEFDVYSVKEAMVEFFENFDCCFEDWSLKE